MAYTLQLGRKEFGFRRALVSSSAEDARVALDQLDPQRVFTGQAAQAERPLIFMFPGQGSQHIQMAAELYRWEPVFHEQLDRCAELLMPLLGFDVRTLLFPAEANAEDASARMSQTAIIQPVLFSVEYALAQLWMSRGLQPQAMIGHSLGEYVAACLAGVFSLEDALQVLVARAQLMQQMPTGSMMAVPLPVGEIEPLLNSQLDIAAINGAALCVVSGTSDAVRQLEQQLAERGITGRRLHISHAAHSNMMEPIIGRLSAQFERITLHAPKIPYVSNGDRHLDHGRGGH